MSSLNKVTLIGNLGQNPEIRQMNNGGSVANFSIATAESWKDKSTGEKRTSTEWHRIVIYNENLVKLCGQYLKKGAKIYLEGQLQTRKWTDASGVDKYTTEIVLKAFNGQIIMLGGNESAKTEDEQSYKQASGGVAKMIDDDLPF